MAMHLAPVLIPRFRKRTFESVLIPTVVCRVNVASGYRSGVSGNDRRFRE